jgi:hypothetical protein
MFHLTGQVIPLGFNCRDLSAIALVLFVAIIACAAGTGKKTLRIGYFLQESQPPYRIGAIKMAIDKAQADGWLPDYNIRCESLVCKSAD